MKEYTIEICETSARIIRIKEESFEKAYEIVSRMYKDGEIILNYSDHLDTAIRRI